VPATTDDQMETRLNWAHLMAAVKLANKNCKKVRKMNEFCLEIW
jgi:hypothetical protein